jgi:hypothetical protein
VITVPENTKGIDIATLTTVDDDVGQPHTYSIVSGDTVNFKLTASGNLMVGCYILNALVK